MRFFRFISVLSLFELGFLSGCGSKAKIDIADVLVDNSNAHFLGIPSPSLATDTRFDQVFVAPHDGLKEVEIFLATWGKKIPSGTLRFRLLSGEGNLNVSATGSMPLADIRDNTFVIFSFPRIPCSRRKTYTLELYTPDIPPGYRLSAWISKTDMYPEGKFLVNGVATPGNAAITTFSEINSSEDLPNQQ